MNRLRLDAGRSGIEVYLYLMLGPDDPCHHIQPGFG
jgi:hypothetical protein